MPRVGEVHLDVVENLAMGAHLVTARDAIHEQGRRIGGVQDLDAVRHTHVERWPFVPAADLVVSAARLPVNNVQRPGTTKEPDRGDP